MPYTLKNLKQKVSHNRNQNQIWDTESKPKIDSDKVQNSSGIRNHGKSSENLWDVQENKRGVS